MDGYITRVVDPLIDRLINIAGAVLIEGVRACGKTETGRHHALSYVRLDTDRDARELARIDPFLILAGDTPRLVDEWQLEPQVWNAIRQSVDDRRSPGQFIMAGSVTPADDITRHSGAGRILRLLLRPMTLFESGHSSGEWSLRTIMEGERPVGTTAAMDLRATVDRLCIGGWPGFLGAAPMDAQELLRSYLRDVALVDLVGVDDGTTRRSPERISRLLAAYSRNVSSGASLKKLAADTATATEAAITPETTASYVGALARIMVVEEQLAWAPHLRSRAVVRQAAVRHFVDPSLAVAALNASPERLLSDPNTLGLLFESMVVRDLRVYAQALDGEVLHYRDSSGREVDAIIQLRDGRWAAVEVKLGSSRVDEAAASLHAMVDSIDITKCGAPAALIVIDAGQYAYTREDGVLVAPLSCLAP